MKLRTLPKNKKDHAILALFGLILLVTLGVVIGLFVWLLHFRYVRLAILFSPALVVISWFAGHIFDRVDTGYMKCECNYKYRFFWMEWLHKRKCLAFIMNGRDNE